MNKLAIALIVLIPAGTAAEPADELGALFPLRAEIEAEGPGLSRLPLPAEVIGSCRADLADLRILARDGREIPYIVDSPEPAQTATRVLRTATPEIIDARRVREVVDLIDVFHESYVLELPPAPDDAPAWDLILTVSRREFVSRLEITAVDGAGRRTAILTGGSAFRLPASDAERLRFPLPMRDIARLELDLENREAGFLEPRFTLEASRMLPVAGASSVDLGPAERFDLARVTELVVDRPRGLVPRRLAISTASDTFHRRVTVWDEGPGADPSPLGSAEVFRVAAIAPVEQLEIPVRPPRGDRLRLVIEDEDSPPLNGVAIAALMPRPVLVFSLPDGASSATLYFGGGRARRPRYDIAAFDHPLPATGEDAHQALAVLDPARSRIATLGAIEPNPAFDPAPVLAFAIHPGAELDSRPYTHRRRLQVTPSDEGLALLSLEPEDLAVLRPDFADLRIVDGDGRQWAYLRQHGTRQTVTPLHMGRRKTEDRVSSYVIEVPHGVLVVDRLTLIAEAPYFDREFELTGRFEDDSQRVIARGRLVRRIDDPRPPTIDVGRSRVTGLVLEIVDGNDAPLIFRRIDAHATAPDLYIAAERGDYDLLVGYPDAEPPVYELERVRSTILTVPAWEVVAGDLEPNPAFSSAGRISGGGAVQKIVLWSVLGAAVIVLAVITFRAARQA